MRFRLRVRGLKLIRMKLVIAIESDAPTNRATTLPAIRIPPMEPKPPWELLLLRRCFKGSTRQRERERERGRERGRQRERGREWQRKTRDRGRGRNKRLERTQTHTQGAVVPAFCFSSAPGFALLWCIAPKTCNPRKLTFGKKRERHIGGLRY